MNSTQCFDYLEQSVQQRKKEAIQILFEVECKLSTISNVNGNIISLCVSQGVKKGHSENVERTLYGYLSENNINKVGYCLSIFEK